MSCGDLRNGRATTLHMRRSPLPKRRGGEGLELWLWRCEVTKGRPVRSDTLAATFSAKPTLVEACAHSEGCPLPGYRRAVASILSMPILIWSYIASKTPGPGSGVARPGRVLLILMSSNSLALASKRAWSFLRPGMRTVWISTDGGECMTEGRCVIAALALVHSVSLGCGLKESCCPTPNEHLRMALL